MWTPTTRQQHSRPVTRHQTDLTDAEWRVIAPHLPKPCATGRPPWTARSDGPIVIGLVDYESPTTLKALLDWKAHGVVNKPIRPFGIMSSLVLARAPAIVSALVP